MRVRAKVSGRVQGVSYRASTIDEARRLGLVGWVKNEPDGSVLLEAQGPAEKVEALIEWCREGPPGARVTGISADFIPESTADTSFRVRF
jgi:acylphosphatase